MNKIAQIITQNNDILVFAHVSPDGDTLGGSLALAHALELMGKRVCLLCSDEPPKYLDFLGARNKVNKTPCFEAKVAIAVDCADRERLGKVGEYFDKAENKLVIDHHVTNDGFGDVNYLDSTVAATGEMIWNLINLLDVKPDKYIAECLFVAISTDTGNFSYSNTTVDTFRISAELLKLGVNISELNTVLYRMRSMPKTKLIGKCIENLEMFCDGKIGITIITYDEIQSINAIEEETEGLIDYIRDIDTIRLAACVRQSATGIFKASLRAKYSDDVGSVAISFGGGGHQRAAGCTIKLPYDEMKAQLLEALKKALV